MTDKPYESSKDGTESEKQSKSNRLLKVIIIILLILLLFVVTTGVVVFVPLIQENMKPSSGVGLQVDPFAGAFVEQKPEPGVTIPGWTSVTIPTGVTVVKTADFYNPKDNEGLYYLTFKLSLLDENGRVSETLYESGLIPPGDHIQTLTLSRGLVAGKYDGVLQIQPYRISDMTPTNNANIQIDVFVR
ncbi:MAG: hypothetical protein IJE95_03710 [Methanocorpusculum sp.]|nr:hypothetical protein [Methanocorpusculum sp.]